MQNSRGQARGLESVPKTRNSAAHLQLHVYARFPRVSSVRLLDGFHPDALPQAVSFPDTPTDAAGLGIVGGSCLAGPDCWFVFQAGFTGLFVYEAPQHLAAAICLGESSAGPARPGADVF